MMFSLTAADQLRESAAKSSSLLQAACLITNSVSEKNSFFPAMKQKRCLFDLDTDYLRKWTLQWNKLETFLLS